MQAVSILAIHLYTVPRKNYAREKGRRAVEAVLGLAGLNK